MNDTIRIMVRDSLGMKAGGIVNIAKFNRD